MKEYFEKQGFVLPVFTLLMLGITLVNLINNISSYSSGYDIYHILYTLWGIGLAVGCVLLLGGKKFGAYLFLLVALLETGMIVWMNVSFAYPLGGVIVLVMALIMCGLVQLRGNKLS